MSFIMSLIVYSIDYNYIQVYQRPQAQSFSIARTQIMEHKLWLIYRRYHIVNIT